MKIVSPGAELLTLRLGVLARGLQNPRPLSKFAALLAVRAVQRNFREEKDSKGKTWPRLKYRIGGTPLNDKRGRMPKGITSDITQFGFRIGAGEETKDFNAIHNFGSKVWHKSGKKKGVPQREYMYLSKKAAEEINKECKVFLKKQITK